MGNLRVMLCLTCESEGAQKRPKVEKLQVEYAHKEGDIYGRGWSASCLRYAEVSHKYRAIMFQTKMKDAKPFTVVIKLGRF